MADYMKAFLKLLVVVSVLLQCSQANEDDDDDDDIVCGFPGAPAFGYVTPDVGSYDQNDIVTYSCRVGYILLGTPARRCNDDGSWTDEVPICDDSMTTLAFASSTPSLPSHGADLAIDRNRETCTYLKPKKPRFWRIDLGGVHTILSVAITLVTPGKPMKYTVYVIEIVGSSSSYKRCATFEGKFGSRTMIHTCAEGKGLVGQKVHIEDHRLDDIFELCEVEVQVEKDSGYECGRPDRNPFSMTEDFEAGDPEVEYQCKQGYELDGDSLRECLPSGHWDGEAPVCKPVECELLTDPENGELTYSIVDDGDVPLEGSTAIYKCNYGYALEGEFTRSCGKDGTWSGDDPTCKAAGSSLEMKEEPRIAKQEGIIFGMAVSVIMMVIILVAFYVVKRRRDAKKPEIPSRQHEPVTPPPRPPPRGLKSTLAELVKRDSSGYKYGSLEDGESPAAWKTRSLPVDPGNTQGITDDTPRRTLSYDDPDVLASRGAPQGTEQSAPEEKKDTYAAVDYDKKRQSRLQKEQDSEERSPGASRAGGQFRDLPPIPKEEEEEARAESAASARSPSTDKDRDEEKRGQDTLSEVSEDVSLPIAASPASEAPTPSPDVVVENQVEGPSASPSTPTSEITPGRRRRRQQVEQPSTEEVPETRRTRTRRRTESGETETPPAPPAEEERPSSRRGRRTETSPTTPAEEEIPSSRRGRRTETPVEEPAEDERPSRRGRRTETPTEEPAEDERPSRRGRRTETPTEEPAEEERPARRTRQFGAGRYDPPVPSYSRRRY